MNDSNPPLIAASRNPPPQPATSSTVAECVLNLRCPDRPGIIAAVTGALYRLGCDIREAAQYGDVETGIFFVRIHLALGEGRSIADVQAGLGAVANDHGIDATWNLLARRMRTLVAVSKQQHCLIDLLHRWRAGLLHADVVGVVSNHEDMRSFTEWHGLPFYHLPVNAENRNEQEASILALMAKEKVDLLVLARYMQILSDETSTKLAGRCINIHHSFLPGFKGAKPYHQAHSRGVKLIGATAHYVTPDLDEGPIIEQSVERVTHATSAQEMVNMGQEVEARVLARAVRWHVEHRVMLNGHKTVVFS